VGLNVIEIGPATENEMIAAFLRAEIDSSRYGNNFVKTSLAQRRLQRNIIDSPNLADAVERLGPLDCPGGANAKFVAVGATAAAGAAGRI
jgi:hypothetical protein